MMVGPFKKVNIYITYILQIKDFLGKEVWRMCWFSLFFGICLFLVESSFVFVMQGFFRTIGLVDPVNIILPTWYPTTLANVILMLISFGVLRGLLYMAKYYICSASGQIFSTLQRERILEYSLRYAENITSGEMLALFSVRIVQAADILISSIHVIITITCCLLFFAYGLSIAPVEMILGTVCITILVIPLRKYKAAITRAGNGVRSEWTNVNNTLVQGLKNHFFLKVYDLVEVEIKKGHRHLQEYNDHHLRYFKFASINNHLPNIAGIFIICIISFISIRYIKTQPMILISFFYIFIRFTQGISEASGNISMIRLHYHGFKELYQWYAKLKHANAQKYLKIEEEKRFKLSENPFMDKVEIELRSVSFGYTDQPLLFKNLNLSVKKGGVLLIKGPSGVGKSSLLMLILGLLKPTEGQILFNKYEIAKILHYLPSVIGYVGPEPYMIVGTIRENLLFGLQDPNGITDSSIIQAMKKAQLDIERFPLDFFVAEQATLSTGQKQRLSIARAILRKPKLLILDEATANLDGETEQNFIHDIKDFLNEVTTIIISHKGSFDQISSSILTLEKKTEC